MAARLRRPSRRENGEEWMRAGVVIAASSSNGLVHAELT